MTIEVFDNAVNGIRADLIEEAAHITVKPKFKAIYRYAAIAAVFVLCVVGGAVVTSHLTNTSPIEIPDNSNAGGNIGIYGGDTSHTVSAIDTLTIKGTGYTDEEIVSMIKENKDTIALNISAEYDCFGSEIQIYTKGYCHAVLGEENCVDLDYLTLPVCIDNRIVANLDVFKANDEFMYTLNVGGDKWDTINEALDYGNKIAFVFAGGYASEAAVAPDNTVFEITHDAKGTLTAGYDLVATEYNTFSSSVLYDSDNYITVIAEK